MRSSRVAWLARCCALAVFVVIGLPVGAAAQDEMLRFDRMRTGQSEWMVSAGRGQTMYVTGKTDVPEMDFNIFGVRYAHFITPKSEVGYSLMYGEQGKHGRNSGISTFIDYSQTIYAKEHFAVSLDLGIGVMRFKDQVRGQGSKTNFNERAGFTMHWATGNKTAFSVSMAFYHASNAGLELPNPGVNVGLLMLNQSWYH
jgi:hypothetical protein